MRTHEYSTRLSSYVMHRLQKYSKAQHAEQKCARAAQSPAASAFQALMAWAADGHLGVQRAEEVVQDVRVQLKAGLVEGVGHDHKDLLRAGGGEG